MARGTRAGLDYFPLDCVLDKKCQLIEGEFGLKGFAVIVKLFQRIYYEFGYYCEWDEDSIFLFSKELGEPHTLIRQIVNRCIDRGLFVHQLYDEYQILTSRGTQKQYLKSTSRRKDVEMLREYLVLPENELAKNVNIISLNDDILALNVNRSAQSKSNSKSNSKSKSNSEAVDPPPPKQKLSSALRVYMEEIDPTPGAYIVDRFKYWIQGKAMEEELIILAIREAVENNAKSWKYIEAILKDKDKRGIRTAEQYEAERKKWQTRRQSSGRAKKSSIGNFEQREYDASTYEDLDNSLSFIGEGD